MGDAAPVPGVDPDVKGVEPVEGGDELVVAEFAADPVEHRGDEGVVVDPGSERGDVHVAADHRVLEVVDRVGDVVGEVHHLGLDAALSPRRTPAHPLEGVDVVVVEPELGASARVADRLARGPRILAAGIEAGTCQVEPVGAAVWAEYLGFDPSEQSKRLGVALETADVRGPVVESPFAVVAEGRMTEVVREARSVDDVRVEAQTRCELASDLGDLEGMRQPVAGEVEAGSRAEDLGLRGETPESAGVQQPRPVAREVAAAARVLLGEPSRRVPIGIGGGRALEHR